jgi:hypothetical protein
LRAIGLVALVGISNLERLSGPAQRQAAPSSEAETAARLPSRDARVGIKESDSLLILFAPRLSKRQFRRRRVIEHRLGAAER